MKNKKPFTWNVLLWDFNKDALESYDVVPYFMNMLKQLKKNKRPKTRAELAEFLNGEAMHQFWSRCEYEMIIHGWPAQKNEEKIDVYDQLRANWDEFVDGFWTNVGKTRTRTSAKHMV